MTELKMRTLEQITGGSAEANIGEHAFNSKTIDDYSGPRAASEPNPAHLACGL